MNINSLLWTVYTRYFGYYYDNAWVLMLLAGLIAGSFIKSVRKISKKNGFLMEIIASVSAYFAMYHFPVAHNRMYVALQSATGIILSSKTYGQNLEHYLNIGLLDSSKIAQALYCASPQQRADLVCTSPTLLYQSFFETYDQITILGVLGNVTKSVFQNGWLSGVLLILIAVFVFYNLKFEKYKKIVCVAILLFTSKYCGAFVFALGMVWVERNTTQKNLYKGSVAREKKVTIKCFKNEKLGNECNG